MNIVNYKLIVFVFGLKLTYLFHRRLNPRGSGSVSEGGGGGGVGSGVGSGGGGGGVCSSVGSGGGGGIPLDSILAPLPRPYFFFDSDVCLTFL